MTGWLARQTLRLYPLAHQRRYGDELRALLEDQPPHAGAVLDLLRGAARAHLRPADAPAGVVDATDRMRASTSERIRHRLSVGSSPRTRRTSSARRSASARAAADPGPSSASCGVRRHQAAIVLRSFPRSWRRPAT